MTPPDDLIEVARRAYRGGDWLAARDAYLTADGEAELPATDHYHLARCWWWVGDLGACRHRLERAHHVARADGQLDLAAVAALELGITYLLVANEPVGSGWIGRAARLATELPEGPIHGYLTFVTEIDPEFASAAPAELMDGPRKVHDIGRRHEDATLTALGLHSEGRALTAVGEITDGLSLIDEAMVSVLAGEVDGTWAGNLYCSTIEVCHELGDLERMKRWTDALAQWLDTLPAAALFSGDCRVHRAQLLTIRGDWDEAEREVSRACDDLADISVANAAQAWYELGEVRRRRGDLDAAEAAYVQANRLGLDPQPGLALVRLAQARLDEAAAAIRTALLSSGRSRARRAQLNAAQVEIAIAGDELDIAQFAADELGSIAADCSTDGLHAMSSAARGAVLLARDEPERAVEPLREACRAWRRSHVPYEAARAGVLLARAYETIGDAEAAGREADNATVAFERLGARLDAAAAKAPRSDAAMAPGGLSPRELEVLRLVADGLSNPEIAATLVISRRTVARHVSNLFGKLGVSSRTEAARFAFEHGLVAPTLAP